MSERWCKKCGQWHDMDKPWPLKCLPARSEARSSLPQPYIRSDGIPGGLWNPTDGKTYDSRSRYEGAVKAAGCEIVGNDRGYWDKARALRNYKPKGIKEDLKKAWDQLGY